MHSFFIIFSSLVLVWLDTNLESHDQVIPKGHIVPIITKRNDKRILTYFKRNDKVTLESFSSFRPNSSHSKVCLRYLQTHAQLTFESNIQIWSVQTFVNVETELVTLTLPAIWMIRSYKDLSAFFC